MMTTVERTKVSFRGLDFQLSVSTSLSSTSPFLDVSLKRIGKSDQDWHGHFTQQFVEDLTKKTGNFKRFSIFAEMVYSTFGQTNQGVSLELISHEDLKTFGKSKGQLKPLTDVHLGQFDKLYLIVTYAVAFDRVHYPLPLTRRGPMDMASQVVEQQNLKTQLIELRKLHEESLQKMSLLMKENDRLRHELKIREKTASQKPKTAKSHQTLSDRFLDMIDDVQIDLRHIHRELNAHHSNPQRTISSLRGLIQTLLRELQLEFKLPHSRSVSSSRTRVRDSSVDSMKSKGTKAKTSSSTTTPLRGRSAYQPVRSQPLHVPSQTSSQKRSSRSDHSRSQSYSRGKLNPGTPNSRSSSTPKSRSQKSAPKPSPFRRFDPTQYVLEQEKKRELQRQRSRSRDSFHTLRSVSRSPSVSSSRSQSNQIKPASSMTDKSTSKLSKAIQHPRVPKPRNIIEQSFDFDSPTMGNVPSIPLHDPSASDIDARLAQLHAYLQSAIP